MSTDIAFIQVSGIDVEIVRKDIKNLHLAVYPPLGRVRVAAPFRIDNEAVRLAVVSRLAWIRRQQDRLLHQARQSRREMIDGESHYAWGRRFRLRVVEADDRLGISLPGNNLMELRISSRSPQDRRDSMLDDWYRAQLKTAAPDLVEKWSTRLGVQVDEWRVRKMKTLWGSCNVEARRIWLNVELAKKRPECLEYIVAHELTHFLERRHNGRFRRLMDEHMPQWRTYRAELNSAPLAHEDWHY